MGRWDERPLDDDDEEDVLERLAWASTVLSSGEQIDYGWDPLVPLWEAMARASPHRYRYGIKWRLGIDRSL